MDKLIDVWHNLRQAHGNAVTPIGLFRKTLGGHVSTAQLKIFTELVMFGQTDL